MVEGIVVLALPEVGKWLPGGAVRGIVRAETDDDALFADLLPAWAAVLVLLGYGLAFSALAARATTRRDIT